MDAIVELCRTGQLGPLRLGMTAADVEQHLGPPDDVKWVHGDSNWQRYRYGNVRLMLTASSPDAPAKHELRLRRIRLDLCQSPVSLPASVASELSPGSPPYRVAELLRLLRESGVDVRLQRESTEHGVLSQDFVAGRSATVISTDGEVTDIEVAESRPTQGRSPTAQ